MLEVDLLLQIPNLKLQSLHAGRSRLVDQHCRSWTQEENAPMIPPLHPWVIGSYNGVFSSQRKSIATHSPSVSLAQRELAV